MGGSQRMPTASSLPLHQQLQKSAQQKPPPQIHPDNLTESMILEEEIDENYEPNDEGKSFRKRFHIEYYLLIAFIF